jgi:hypothetical protein
MTKTLLNRETAAKQAAVYYVNSLIPPNELVEGIDYNVIAKKVLKGSDSSKSESPQQLILYQNIMIYSGLKWDLYITDEFEEQLQLKMREWIATS